MDREVFRTRSQVLRAFLERKPASAQGLLSDGNCLTHDSKTIAEWLRGRVKFHGRHDEEREIVSALVEMIRRKRLCDRLLRDLQRGVVNGDWMPSFGSARAHGKAPVRGHGGHLFQSNMEKANISTGTCLKDGLTSGATPWEGAE